MKRRNVYWFLLALIAGCYPARDVLKLPSGNVVAIIIECPGEGEVARMDHRREIELFMNACINGAKAEIVKFKGSYTLRFVTADSSFTIIGTGQYLKYKGRAFKSHCDVEREIRLLAVPMN